MKEDPLASQLSKARAPRDPAPIKPFLTRMLVRQVRINPRREDHPDETEGALIVVSASQVLYAFLGSAVFQGLIDADWKFWRSLRRDRIYLRTKAGVFLTGFRSLCELLQRMKPGQFLRVHQSVLVNADYIHRIVPLSRVKQLSVRISDKDEEWLTIGRRHLEDLREALGSPGKRWPR